MSLVVPTAAHVCRGLHVTLPCPGTLSEVLCMTAGPTDSWRQEGPRGVSAVLSEEPGVVVDLKCVPVVMSSKG